jgi:acyl transferase domain-containing protein
VMKTVLMLRHGEIPAALDPEDGPLNEHIDWASLPFTVPRDHQPWPAALGGRVASVNSFGMSGTNVHAVLAAAPPVPDGDPVPPEQPHLLILSARSMPALTALAQAVGSRLGKAAPAEVASICHTLRCGRAAFPYRLAVVASTGPDLAVRIEEALRRPIAAAPPGGPGPLRLRSGDAGAPQLLQELGVHTVPEPATGPAQLAWGDRRYPLTTAELTLTAVAALFEDGAELRFDALRGPHDRFVDDLPTYPFQRRRFWVDEPVPGGPVVTAAPERADGAAPDAADRTAVQDYLAARLREVLDADELDEQRSFLDSGGDSFASVLFVQRVEEAYEIGVRPEDLPLDLPLTEFLGRLAAGVTRRTGTAS